jgi:hypothetical protein
MTANDIKANFMRAYPTDSIVVYKFKSGGFGSYNGEKLLDVTLDNGYNLRIYKLLKSSGAHMNTEEIKAKALPFIYESRNMIDDGQRHTILQNKFKTMFPNHYVNVFIFNGSDWARQSNNTKGSIYFEKDYDSEVDVVLN